MIFKVLLIVVTFMLSAGVCAGELVKSFTFSSSQVLLASEANSNFQTLSSGISGLESRLNQLDSGSSLWSGIPYTFVDGTRTKASEIRENYSVVASGINTLRDRIKILDSVSTVWGGVPHTIMAGQPITSSVLNEKFDTLYAELNSLQDRVADLEGSTANQAPTASLSVSPTSGDTSTSFQFDASASSDSEDASNTLQVRWDWDGDSNWDTSYTTNQVVSHAFPNANSYTVWVQVKDSAGLTDIISRPVEVSAPNQAPTASFTVLPSSGDTGTSFQFDASGSSDPEDAVGALQVRWDWDGDSNWDTSYSTSKTTSHLFDSADTYTIQIQVKDSEGLTHITSHQVTVKVPNQAPTASFTVLPSSGDTGTSFQFDASGSSDPEDAVGVLQVRWDWNNDSNWDTTYSTNKTTSHSFSSSATYSVKMEVKDTGGLTATTTSSVTVENVATVADTYSNSLGMDFKQISSGTFTMGSPSSEADRLSREGPQHQVTISKAFYMQTTEVTQGQWKAVMGSNPSSFSSCGDNCPVENVSWDDIQTFLTTLNGLGQGTYRLPTEAEWEYAARAGTTTAYSFGDSSSSLGDYGWYKSNSSDKTHPVATKLPNPWGLYDMHGNVWEWVSDWYSSSYYTSAAVTNPQGPSSGSDRVYRGGGLGYGASALRSAIRNDGGPGGHDDDVGFRLLATVADTYSNNLGMDFKQISSGTFTMGSPSSEAGRNNFSEGPQHQVTISKAFYMQTTEVTQGQWKAVMGSNPSYFSSCGDGCPVEQVSWDDIQTFLTTLNGLGQGTYRLPTEAEWEYAARAGTTTAYSFGDSSSSLGDYGWYDSNSSDKTHPVATKLPNPWGLYDMHGNVYEWVSGWYSSSYDTSTALTDPQGPSSGSYRVYRGGSWDEDAFYLRSAHRYGIVPGGREYYIGFRLLRTYP